MKNKLKDNLAIKIISVCAAIVLWFYIQMVQNPEIDYTFKNMRVSVMNSSLLEERNLVVIDDIDFKADITVNCPNQVTNIGSMFYIPANVGKDFTLKHITLNVDISKATFSNSLSSLRFHKKISKAIVG